jgi:hypothetical protein
MVAKPFTLNVAGSKSECEGTPRRTLLRCRVAVRKIDGPDFTGAGGVAQDEQLSDASEQSMSSRNPENRMRELEGSYKSTR